MKEKKGLLGFYNYTVVLTYIGMLSGFLGIVNAFENKPFAAILCLLFSGLCDMFDGAVASTMERTHAQKDFGIQIDSLADLICFGVLPASIVYGMFRTLPVLVVCALYNLCALIRLAFFNVDERERQKTQEGPRKVYLGLPVTLSAIFIPLSYSLNKLLKLKAGLLPLCSVIFMGAAFITPFELKKPGKKGKVALLVAGFSLLALVIFANR